MVYIKRMICEGFKSFRRKTIVNFDSGFTAIIGANGSGKSNIIDAFVFVLGELSAKTLRANNIKDLISNGGNGLPASDTATVEIIFDNKEKVFPSDEEEISILRKIDRSGNGIYKLNGKRSTRREIMDQLDLAGVLPNSSNMIMQGELFRLITMNALERRQLIENIAGIGSYNEKKTSAEQELEKVKTNLGQITILLNEVRTQMEQLEKEKQDAERYLTIINQEKIHRNNLFYLKINNAKHSIETYISERVFAEKEINRIQDLEAKTKINIEEIQIQIDKVQDKIKAVENAELAQITTQINQIKDTITELKTNIKYTTQNLDKSEVESKNLQQKMIDLENQATNLTTEITELTNKKGNLGQQIAQTNEEIIQLETKIQLIDQSYIELKEKFRTISDEIKLLQEQKNKQELDLTVIESQIQNQEQQKNKLEQKIYAGQQEIVKYNKQLAQLETEKATLISKHGGEDFSRENVEVMIKKYEKRITELQTKQKILAQTAREKHAALVELQSSIKVYKQINSGNNAVTAILNLKKTGEIPGIFGTIAALGSADAQYAIALEMAAAGKFTWIVVDHAYTAEKCIQYLKEKKIGRATFIPLSAVKISPVDFTVPDDPKIYGRAVDLISFDPFVKKAFEFVFGRTIIVEDIHMANNLKLPARRVTLDGDVVESSNIMSGGQKVKPTGVGFKASETAEIEALESQNTQIQLEIDSNDTEIKQLQVKISDLYRHKISGDKESQQVTEQIAVIQTKIDQLTNEIHLIEQEASEILKLLGELIIQKEQIQKQIQKLLPIWTQKTTEANTYQKQLDASDESSLKSELRQKETELKRLNKLLSNIEIEYTKKSTMLYETIHNSREESTTQLINLKSVIEKYKENLSTTQAQLSEKQTDLTQSEIILAEKSYILAGFLEERKQLLVNQSNMKLELAQYSNDIYPLQLKINTCQIKSSDLESKIGEWQCQIDPEIQISEEFKNFTEQEIQSSLDQLILEKTQIGAVNLKAIEKYSEIETRYKDLESKNEQVIEEREAILQFIENLETEKKKVFLNTFNNINKNFMYIFSRLSPGGEAKLELENMEEPFAGGVEILARPGEKKWCLTQAMSGGEKTLTIIALILGIQMHVPSPYYILDEIDAALDFANAALVADLIKELSARSQFIIITHRDVTMARTDHLLGVSNREGVTSVINLSIKNVLKALSKEGKESNSVEV